MEQKLLLIDGHSILNRAFYGVPDLTNSQGIHTGAVYGFLNIILKILDEEKPGYFAVAFDEHAPTFRHEIYEAYKGTRKPMPEELRAQVPLTREVLSAMGVPILSKPGLEADDIIGTTARRWEEKGYEVCIVSGDRDLLQLVTDHTRLLLPRTSKGQTTVTAYDPEEVEKEYSLPPLGIIELKALMGDSSDNIPGVPKIGPKTATELLLKYGNIENLKDHISEINKKSVRETLQANFNLAELSKTLATIETNADILLSEEDAVLTDLFTPEAYEIVKSLELKSLFKRFEGLAEKEEKSLQERFHIINDLAGAEKAFASACEAADLGFAADYDEAGDLSGLALATDEEANYIVREGFITSAYLGDGISKLLELGRGRLFTVGLKELLKKGDFHTGDNLFDLEIELYLLDPLRSDYGIPGNAREGALAALNEGRRLLPQIREEGMEDLLKSVEMPLIPVLSSLEAEGICVRREELSRFSKELGQKIDLLEQEIYEGAGEKFNINSPKQLGLILFEKMGLKGGKKTKTGYSTSAEVLEKLAPKAPIIGRILEFRQLSKLKSTYADGLEPFIDEGGRIHSTFNQTITATGRISSADPNLQNIPVRTELGREFRKIFIPKEGYCFTDADYSQIELRILASMSGDDKLIGAYQEDKDIHAITASQVFHVPFEEVTADL
ncbi:MAG: DNA polymerase I, partial [Lachnospiraceae bacterium]|nr:DNA polymerase I [Lachnospiraceae bacterium]